MSAPSETTLSRGTSDAPDDDGWETDEEEVVHVQLSGIFQSDLLTNAEVRFVGVETDEPIVQIGSQVFVGKYEDVVGTAVFLRQKDQVASEKKEDDDEDAEEEAAPPVEFVCKTEKRLVLRRVFLEPKEKDNPDDLGQRK